MDDCKLMVGACLGRYKMYTEVVRDAICNLLLLIKVGPTTKGSQSSGNSGVPVPVPVYCRPLAETSPGMKIWCAAGVNLMGGYTKDGGLMVSTKFIIFIFKKALLPQSICTHTFTLLKISDVSTVSDHCLDALHNQKNGYVTCIFHAIFLNDEK